MPIFDQGYQHWAGALSGRGWRALTITREGLRVQWKGWLLRILFLLAWLPALALIVVLAVWGLFEQGTQSILDLVKPMLPSTVAADPRAYRLAVWTIAYSTFFKFEIFFIMLLVVVAGPNLISRDLRFNALPLYFSRPLTRFDYFLGKLGVIAALVAAVAMAPAAVAYLLGVCFSLELGVIRDTWWLLPASMLYGLVIVVSAGPLMLALSSLSRRTLYVGIGWVGVWVISNSVALVLDNIQRDALYGRFIDEQHEQRQKAEQQQTERPSANQAELERRRNRRRGRHGLDSSDWQRVQDRVDQARAEAAPRDWRPLCSYTGNVQRLGEELLGSDAAWVAIGRAIELPRAAISPWVSGGVGQMPAVDERRLANQYVPQHPWPWSAGVLAGLLALSLWTLSTRVKSLDRLR